MSTSKLFEPYKLGKLTLTNRTAMAPLTRNRAQPGFVPGPLAAEYYSQRASAGLLITEASQISQQGQGYQDTPGIYSPEQVAGWKQVTDAVHAKGGHIFIQLWHVGRISHTSLEFRRVRKIRRHSFSRASRTCRPACGLRNPKFERRFCRPRRV